MPSDDLSTIYTFIDSSSEWNKVLEKSKLKLNPDLFNIEHTFVDTEKVNSRKRKRPTKEWIDLQESHIRLTSIVNHFKISDPRCKPSECTNSTNESYNKIAKDIARKYIDNNELIKYCKHLTENNEIESSDKKFEYFHKVINNDDSLWKEIKVLSWTYLLPPMSSFIMSDIKFANKLLCMQRKFDLIVIDPPVYNKSVQYKSVYDFLDENDILELPLRQIMNDNCIVAIWCTNSEKYSDSVQSCMLPAWGLQLRAQCTWLKITNGGDSVLHINDPYRRPYEKLFIARFSAKTDSAISVEDDPLYNLHDHVLLSVPCSLHSTKPNLENFLESYLPTTGRQCLELFARNLYPGWVSWGNEPLKFLRTDLMIENIET